MRDEDVYREFRKQRALFAERMPWMSRAKLALLDRDCVAKGHCRDRDLAFAEQSLMRVSMLSRALDLPRSNIVGLMRHELGHLADPDIDEPGREQRADDIARWVTGRRIYYDAQDIQTISRSGKYPRPLYLHR